VQPASRCRAAGEAAGFRTSRPPSRSRAASASATIVRRCRRPRL